MIKSKHQLGLIKLPLHSGLFPLLLCYALFLLKHADSEDLLELGVLSFLSCTALFKFSLAGSDGILQLFFLLSPAPCLFFLAAGLSLSLFLCASLFFDATTLSFHTAALSLNSLPLSLFCSFSLFFGLAHFLPFEFHRVESYLLDHILVITHLCEAVATAETAAKWEGRLRDIEVCRRMMNSEWAVVPIAVLNH